MKVLSRSSRLRRLVSSAVTIAMTFSLIVMPVGTATAADPGVGNPVSIVDGGTNLTTFGDVDKSTNGLNGVASVEVTGSLATQSRLQARYAGITDSKTLYAAGARTFSGLKIWYGSPEAAVATTITGLTATSTVGMLRARIEAQVPNVTTSIEGSPTRLWLTAEEYGKVALAVSDTAYGIGPAIFGIGLTGQVDAFGYPLGTVTKGLTFSGGSGYDGGYFGGGVPLTAAASFATSPSISYAIGAATFGTIDTFGTFVAETNDLGLYTAVKLPTGYDLVLSSVGGAGIGHGTATVEVSGGVRDLLKPDMTIRQSPNPVLAGDTATITAQFTAMPSSGGIGGIDEATFTLPEGFTPSDIGATARVGSVEASIVVDAPSRTITVNNFVAMNAEALTVTLASQVPTVPGEYAVQGTYSNIGSAATGTLTAFGRVKVVALDIAVTASPDMGGLPNYGYAQADGVDTVTFTVKTNVPKAGVRILAEPSSTVGVGSLDATSAVTDEDGIATFEVSADSPSEDGDIVKYGRKFKQFTFTDEADADLTVSGFAHFYMPEVSAVGANRLVAFADGSDKITYAFMVIDPVTRQPAPAGTRMFFAACGSDREDTALSASSALTDDRGVVSVDVTRDEATGVGGLVWVTAQVREPTQTATPPLGTPTVQFLDYIASTDDTITGQQSTRGAAATADFVIKDAAGNVVDIARLGGVIEGINTDVLKSAPLSSEARESTIHVSVEVKADDPNVGRHYVAGDRVQAALIGTATVAGPLGSETPVIFGADMPIDIVNNARAMGLASVFLGKANITGENLRPGTAAITAVQGDNTYVLTATTIGIDLDGAARPQLFDLPVTMLKGTYDLVIDGITFPGALVVTDGIAIGVQKVVIHMGASRGVYPNYATQGSTITLFGVVTTAANANIPSSIVNVYSSASPDGSNPTFIGAVITSNGQFGYRVTADRGKYYFATTNPNSQYMAGDSRVVFGGALFVGVKTRASLKVTYAPSAAIAGRAFTVKGVGPRHAYDTTMVFQTFKLVSGRWVYKNSFSVPLAAGSTAFSRQVKLTSKGYWVVRVAHADYDHVSSASANRAITGR